MSVKCQCLHNYNRFRGDNACWAIQQIAREDSLGPGHSSLDRPDLAGSIGLVCKRRCMWQLPGLDDPSKRRTEMVEAFVYVIVGIVVAMIMESASPYRNTIGGFIFTAITWPIWVVAGLFAVIADFLDKPMPKIGKNKK